MTRHLLHAALVLSFCAVSGRGQTVTPTDNVVPAFLSKHCLLCHNTRTKTADLSLEPLREAKAAPAERDVWEKVLNKVRAGDMPPPGLPRPSPADLKAFSEWVSTHLDRLDSARKPDPGRITARRLNRAEYNNTIRDLVGVDLRPADDFPVDDTGYGFDNIGDVLSLSPVLMEKYLAAAEKVARAAILAGPPARPTMDRYDVERLGTPDQAEGEAEGSALTAQGALVASHRFLSPGEYDLRVGLRGISQEGGAPLRLAILLDGQPLKLYEVEQGRDKKRSFEVRVPVPPGRRQVAAAFLDEGKLPPAPASIDPVNPPLHVDNLEIRGPYNVEAAPAPESHARVFVCGHPVGGHQEACACPIMTNLARRAWRRPVSEAEADGLLRFVNLAQQEGEGFEQAIRLALQAVLVSPHFLFRIERDPDPLDAGAAHPVSDYELASRLSYFLWSSMPDAELFRLAEEGALSRPGVLAAQARRMLADPRSRALVDNFAGQWLELRNLDEVKPDHKRFPSFDESLRQAMRRETSMFFETVLREDRSLVDFIDGRYTFLNERLARHYGIQGVQGSRFRRVELDGAQRSGLLTQASILTVSSYPTRTSPVLRGLWVLENFLGAPPPPPPAGVPTLDEDAIGTSGSLRQQLERHRADPACAVCHNRMDALGFGLENYDAVGAWRTHDGKFPVDAAGTLPGGRSFSTPAEMKAILKGERDAFALCLAEKMLTYALGRGLEPYDRPVLKQIVRNVAAGDYRLSGMILEIVNSPPFRMRRGEGVKR